MWEQIDLILLDVRLGADNGFAFCRKLRRNTDVPVLFLTAGNRTARGSADGDRTVRGAWFCLRLPKLDGAGAYEPMGGNRAR